MYSFIIFSGLLMVTSATREEIRWCLISDAERTKCDQWSSALSDLKETSQQFSLICVMGKDAFDCMLRVSKRTADVIGLDVGLGYHASQNYRMRAIAYENYNEENEKSATRLKYLASAVVVRGSLSHPKDLKRASSCHPGTGSAEGWIYPLSRIIKEKWIKVSICSSEVKTASAFFQRGSCAPGSLSTIFNHLGDNPIDSCSRCANDTDSRRFCSSQDQYAGNAGAILCLDRLRRMNQVAVAFVRGDVIARMVATGDLDPSQFELLCPDRQKDGTFVAALDQISRCRWGTPQSRVIMTELTSDRLAVLKRFLQSSIEFFGPNGTRLDKFKLFESRGPYSLSLDMRVTLGASGLLSPVQPSYDLIFSDSTRDIFFPTNSESINYDDVMSQDLKEALALLASCPLLPIRFCVINEDALDKCAAMKLAISSHHIQPGLHCVLGESTSNCIRLISEGFADVMTLDAAEMFVAGKYFGLVPIATESYGEETFYYGVAVAKRENKDILISNWKNKYLCLGGAGKASGWVLPVTAALNTGQIRVENRSLIYSFSQLVNQACIPGILDEDFVRSERLPINVCELCTGGGADLCQANGVEGYYLDSGAFSCLIEIGDLAFVRHSTPHDNTDGRNSAMWARNMRSDDFELLCPNGKRTNIYSWKDCNLGRVPANFVVTARFKSQPQRDGIWELLRHSQALFASDSNPVFSMFSSTYNRYDLMFSDSTTHLLPIPPEQQSYEAVLDPPFMRKCTYLENLSKPGHSGFLTP